MNDHREEVPVMLMLRREPVYRTGPLCVIGKVHTAPVFCWTHKTPGARIMRTSEGLNTSALN
jgi:hypothetical protein